jgi:hypothetical protein
MKTLIIAILLFSVNNVFAENMYGPEWRYGNNTGWYPNPHNSSSGVNYQAWRKAYESCYKQAFIQSEVKTNYQGYASEYLFRDLYEQCMGSYGHFVVEGAASRVQYGEHYTTRGYR